LVNLLLFYRRPRLEAGALVVSAVGLGVLGEVVFSNWLLVGVGVLVLLQGPGRDAAAKAARRLGRQYPDLPVAPERLRPAAMRDLFGQVMRVHADTRLLSVVRHMLQVHERAAVPPLSLPARSGFPAVYAGVMALTLITGSVSALPAIMLPRPSGGTHDAPRND